MTGRYRYAISATGIAGSYVYLFSAKVLAPLNLYIPALSVQKLASGGLRFEGAPVCTWYYAYLDPVARAFFRSYCPGLFAEDIYIHTLNDENVWVNARTIMNWQSQEKYESDSSIGFTFTFKVKSAVAL